VSVPKKSKGSIARVKRYLDSRASDNHERWLVSYADFITLLFAFFVVMYAISSVNEGKYRVLGDSIGSAFRLGGPGVPGSSQLAAIRPGAKPLGQPGDPALARQRAAEMDRRLETALAPLAGQVRLQRHPRGVTVEIGAGALFAPGQASLREESRGVLAALAGALKDGDQPIEVEGHTDNAPISTPQFPSNWELSAARAGSVVRVLAEHGVAPARLAAIGYGEFRPVAANATDEGRARNRRVSVTVVEQVTRVESGQASERTSSSPPMEFPIGNR
jgi:chemotaxis protein MotB